MISFKQHLNEGKDSPIFHGTIPMFAESMLKSDILRSSPKDRSDSSPEGISCSRNITYAKKWVQERWNFGHRYVVIQLNQRKLITKYRIAPVNFYHYANSTNTKTRYLSADPIYGQNEYEERILTHQITNLSMYISAIYIAPSLQDYPNDILLQSEYPNLFQHPKLYINGVFVNKQ